MVAGKVANGPIEEPGQALVRARQERGNAGSPRRACSLVMIVGDHRVPLAVQRSILTARVLAALTITPPMLAQALSPSAAPPIERVLPDSEASWGPAAMVAEPAALRAHPDVAARDGDALQIILRDGRHVIFRDCGQDPPECPGIASYHFVDHVPGADLAVLLNWSYGSVDFTLVDRSDGTMQRICAKPVFAPSGTRFLTRSEQCGGGAMAEYEGLEVWERTSNRFVRRLHVDAGSFAFRAWLSDDIALLERRDAGGATPVTLERRDGIWSVRP